MNHIFAKVKNKRKSPYFKLISDASLFEAVNVDLNYCVPYLPDHNLDEDAWFKIENFSNQPFFLDFLKSKFDSKDFQELPKIQFSKIAYLLSFQSDNVFIKK